MATERAAVTDDDRALLDRVAARVVELRLEVPAVLAIESASPLSLLAGQAMLFFEPFVAAWLRLPDYRRFAALVQRRDALELLARAIETRANAEIARRRARTARS
jgi:hypothetical protein